MVRDKVGDKVGRVPLAPAVPGGHAIWSARVLASMAPPPRRPHQR
jgi:hypothetical protein